jgi:hypothetical protein
MLGRKPRIVPDHALMDGIQAGRHTIPVARFDAARCARGIECLKSYQAEWSEELRTFKKTPKHDWASHAADAWRYLAIAWKVPLPRDEEKPDPVAELLKPRTWQDMWSMHFDEQIDRGADAADISDQFNLNGTAELV